MTIWSHIVWRIPSLRIKYALFFAEVWASLLFAHLLTRTLPFRMIERGMRRRPGRSETQGKFRCNLIAATRNSIARAAPLLPVEPTCFTRCVAAQSVLRRHGVYTTLYYGAASRPALEAHTWLMDGDTPVIDSENAGDYRILARYPEAV